MNTNTSSNHSYLELSIILNTTSYRKSSGADHHYRFFSGVMTSQAPVQSATRVLGNCLKLSSLIGHVLGSHSCVDTKLTIHYTLPPPHTASSLTLLTQCPPADQLLNLALSAGPQEQIEAARYFTSSERPQIGRAVTLYHRAGLLSKVP